MPRRPYENGFSKHMGMLFLKKNLPKTTHEKMFWKKVFEKRRNGHLVG